MKNKLKNTFAGLIQREQDVSAIYFCQQALIAS